MRSEKQNIQEVSARVVLTPMPQDGVDQFNFLKRENTLSANKVEALLEFNDHVDFKDLFSCLNKLLGVYISASVTDLSPEDAVALECTYGLILNVWRAETNTFEQLHPNFLAG